MVDGSLMGALTADAVDPHAFEALEDRFLEALGALAAATLRTTLLIEKVEETAERQGMLAQNPHARRVQGRVSAPPGGQQPSDGASPTRDRSGGGLRVQCAHHR